MLLEKVKQQNKVDGIGKLRTEGRVPMVGLTYKVCSQPRCTGSRHLVMGKTGSGGICRVHHEKHGTGRNKLESRVLGKILITSDMQLTPPL